MVCLFVVRCQINGAWTIPCASRLCELQIKGPGCCERVGLLRIF